MTLTPTETEILTVIVRIAGAFTGAFLAVLYFSKRMK
jgi:hypothetical protein